MSDELVTNVKSKAAGQLRIVWEQISRSGIVDYPPNFSRFSFFLPQPVRTEEPLSQLTHRRVFSSFLPLWGKSPETPQSHQTLGPSQSSEVNDL